MPKRLLFVLAWLGLFLGFLYWVDPGFWRGAEGHYEIALALRAEGEYAEGLEHLDRALRTEPDDPGLLRTRGYLALELGRAEEAMADFHQALEAEPRDSEALLGLARAEAALGHPKRAHRALSELPARLETFEQRLERARLLVDAEDLSEAWSRYHLLAREKPNNAVVLEEASAVAAMVGHWDEVLSLAERLADITTEPKVRSRAVERAAEAAWASGRPELASELYERVSGPENLEARARLSFELERYSETAELHLELKALDPEARKIRTNLAYSLARAGRLEEAEAEYEWLLDEMPDDSELLVPYIEVLNRRSRYQRAWRILSSLPTPSTDIETHWLQAQTAHWAGESDVAARLLESWSERNPDDPRPYLLLAESRRRTGDRAGRADALKRYLNQEPDDVEVRMQLADILADDERVFEAILHYREIVMLSPEDPDALTRLGVLFETTGDHQSALRRYEQAAAAASQPSTDLVTRLGRLHAWTGDAEGALPWYEELLSRSLDTEKRRVATLELAEALLASGRPGDALARVSSAAEDSSDEAAQLLAARAASGAGDRGGAVRYLDRLAKVRSLSFEEIRWLAGEQRGAGDPVRALETYEELLSRYPHDTELLLAVGDLRLDGHDPARAKEAYGRIPVEAGPLAAVSGLARANSALGDRPGAAALYREYLAERPNDHAVRLELAQVLMLAGQSGPAVEEYERYLSARGEDGIGLELTRAYLDQEDYEKAVSFALHAEARGEDVHQVRLARAQALGALGEIREADRILQSLADGPPPADDLTWAARLAEVRNRPVGALFEAQAALEAGAEPAAELHLLQARALGSRGDVSRALASLRRARESGADTARVRQALDEFRLTLATELEIPLLFQTDDGGLRIPQGGITARFNVANRFRLGLSTNLGKIEQRGVTFDRWVMAITVDRWFPVP